jgi:hypothetical protein
LRSVKLPQVRNRLLLWINEHQLGRRNLTDDQRAVIANEVRELMSKIAQHEAAKIAADARWTERSSDLADSTKPHQTDNRKAVAEQHKLPQARRA